METKPLLLLIDDKLLLTYKTNCDVSISLQKIKLTENS